MAVNNNGNAALKEHTPTQRRMLAILKDGMRHRKSELVPCLNDELADEGAVYNHICQMNKILERKGQRVICEKVGWATYYRHVRLLSTQE